MRHLALGLIVGLGVLFCGSSVAIASRAPEPRATESVTLAPDPFLDAAQVTTSIPMAVRCPCSIYGSCAYKPIGYDCASPSNCCHCSGINPATRMCVFNAR